MEALGDCFTAPPLLDAAHRLGPPRSAEGSTPPRPRTFIVKFHYLHDKEEAMKCRKERHTFRDHNILLFPDVPSTVSKKIASFKKVKHSLWKKNVKMTTLDDGSLRVVFDGVRNVFHTPEEAQRFYDQHFATDDEDQSTEAHSDPPSATG